jgi:hypothetical protein
MRLLCDCENDSLCTGDMYVARQPDVAQNIDRKFFLKEISLLYEL